MTGGPAGSLYSVFDSGWMEGANFKQWVEKMFLPAVKHLTSKNPVLLIFDGHHSHISFGRITFICFVFLPHYTPASASGCWSLWATEAGIEEDPQGASDRDMYWHNNKGGLPRPHIKALGTVFQSSTHQEWISKDRVASLV